MNRSKLQVALMGALLALGAGAAWPQTAAAQAQAAQQYSIPAGELESALRHYATQNRLQLVYSSELVAGKRSAGLTGSYTREEALARLLSGSGLHAEPVDANTIALRRAGAGPTPRDEARAVPAEASADDGVTDIDTVMVTGTRISRPELDEPNPVQTFSIERIQRSGKTNITDFLKDSPALTASMGNQDTAGTSTYGTPAGIGLNMLDLRNLGSARTLVLVNGRRHVAGMPGEASVDVGSIPTALIDRVDVLTGGVSAIYGADGVSGVVNFLLKRDFEGLEASVQTGMSSRGDANEHDASVVFGRNFADMRGNVAVAYQYTASKRLSEKKRDHIGDPYRTYMTAPNPDDPFAEDPDLYDYLLFNDVRYAESSPNGAIDVDFDGIADYQGDGRPYDGGRLLGEGVTQGGSGTPLAGFNGDLLPRDRQHNLNVLASFDASPALRLFAEGKYIETSVYTQAQPTFDFGTVLAPDNAFLNRRLGALAPDGALMNRDNLDLGHNEDFVDRKLKRIVVGAAGDLGERLRYEASYAYGESKSHILKTRNRLTDRYYAALDAVVDPATGRIVCRSDLFPEENIDPLNYDGPAVTFTPGPGSGCRPLNLLGEGAADPAAADFVYARSTMDSRITQQVFSGSVSGDLGGWFELPGGPVGFAVGAEYRKETSLAIPSEDLLQDQVLDIGPYAVTRGSFDVREVFGELSIPVLADARYAKTLSFGAAIRFSDYSTIGHTTTWKLDGVYAPVEDIAFRTTYSQAVRAPNIAELYAGPSSSFDTTNDPCDPSNLGSGTSYRAANCVALLQQLGLSQAQIDAFAPNRDPSASVAKPSVSSGNPDLSEERARTWTAGVVFRPRFLKGFTLSLDWYDIGLEDAINTAGGFDISQLCVDQPSIDNVFCDAVTRDPDTGFITGYHVRPENVSAFRTSGLDLSVNYRFTPRAGIGTFEFDLVGGYLRQLEFVATPGADTTDRANMPWSPRRIASLGVTWEKGGLSLNYALNWQSRTLSPWFTPEQLAARPDLAPDSVLYVEERREHSLQASYDLDDRLTLFAGIRNFTDQKPHTGLLSWPVSPVGRYFYMGARARFR